MIEVGPLEWDGLEVEAVVVPVRADGSGLSPIGRHLEQAVDMSTGGVGMGEEFPVGAAVFRPSPHPDVPFVILVVVQSHEEAVTLSGVRRGLTNALRRAAEWEIGSIGMPALGVGAGNLDAQEFVRVLGPVLDEHIREGGPPGRFLLLAADSYQREVFDRLKISLESDKPDS